MQTQCPQCETRFRITEVQLSAAEGNVRCGLCDEVFNAQHTENFKEDIKLPEIIQDETIEDIEKTPTDSEHNKKFQQQEETEQNTALKTDGHDNAEITLDETPSSDSDNVVALDIEEPDLEEPDVKELDTEEPDIDELDKNERQDDANINLNNVDLDSKDNADNEEKEKNESQTEPEESGEYDNNDIDVDELDPPDDLDTELDIDNLNQEDDAEPEEIFLDEHASDLDTDIEIDQDDEAEQPSDFFDDDNNQDSPQIIPDELREGVAANDVSIGKNIAWLGGILLLSTILFLQYFWLNRDQFVQHPSAQALIEKACLKFDCSKFTIRDPSNIELLTRNVFSHPNEKNTLMISIVLQNNAKFSQPYPMLQVNFSDIRGDDVVARRFTPAEYLETKQEKHPLLQPGTDASFNLEIQDPGKQAITYEFNFL